MCNISWTYRDEMREKDETLEDEITYVSGEGWLWSENGQTYGRNLNKHEFSCNQRWWIMQRGEFVSLGWLSRWSWRWAGFQWLHRLVSAPATSFPIFWLPRSHVGVQARKAMTRTIHCEHHSGSGDWTSRLVPWGNYSWNWVQLT